jgi:hypothetical protein
MVNNMFMRVAGEALGIKLTFQDIDTATSAVVKADIVQYKNPPAPVPQKKQRSSFCVIQ